jgi:hypothetical protein
MAMGCAGGVLGHAERANAQRAEARNVIAEIAELLQDPSLRERFQQQTLAAIGHP